MLVPNVFCVAADEQEFRFGTVAFKIDSDEDVKLQRDPWKPWLSQYPTRRAYWTASDDELDDDPVRAAVLGLLQPCNVIDFLGLLSTPDAIRDVCEAVVEFDELCVAAVAHQCKQENTDG